MIITEGGIKYNVEVFEFENGYVVEIDGENCVYTYDELIELYNPYRDKLGRFASKAGGVAKAIGRKAKSAGGETGAAAAKGAATGAVTGAIGGAIKGAFSKDEAGKRIGVKKGLVRGAIKGAKRGAVLGIVKKSFDIAAKDAGKYGWAIKAVGGLSIAIAGKKGASGFGLGKKDVNAIGKELLVAGIMAAVKLETALEEDAYILLEVDEFKSKVAEFAYALADFLENSDAEYVGFEQDLSPLGFKEKDGIYYMKRDDVVNLLSGLLVYAEVKLEEETPAIVLYNPFRDELGRFATAAQAGVTQAAKDVVTDKKLWAAIGIVASGEARARATKFSKEDNQKFQSIVDRELAKIPDGFTNPNVKVKAHNSIGTYAMAGGGAMSALAAGYVKKIGHKQANISPMAKRWALEDGKTEESQLRKDFGETTIIHEALHTRPRNGSMNVFNAKLKMGIEEGLNDILTERFTGKQSTDAYASYRHGMAKIASKLNDGDHAAALKWIDEAHKKSIGPNDIARQLSEKTGKKVRWNHVVEYVNAPSSSKVGDTKLGSVVGRKSGAANKFNSDKVKTRTRKQLSLDTKAQDIVTGTMEAIAGQYIMTTPARFVWGAVINTGFNYITDSNIHDLQNRAIQVGVPEQVVGLEEQDVEEPMLLETLVIVPDDIFIELYNQILEKLQSEGLETLAVEMLFMAAAEMRVYTDIEDQISEEGKKEAQEMIEELLTDEETTD
jgi:hypothetical protein